MDDALSRPEARAMRVRGRPTAGWVEVAPAGLDEAAIADRIAVAVRFVDSLTAR